MKLRPPLCRRYVYAHNNLGHIFFDRRKDFEAAERCFREAVRLDAREPHGWVPPRQTSRRLSSQSRTLRRSSRRSWMPWALSTARPSFSCVTLPFAALAESVFLTKTL